MQKRLPILFFYELIADTENNKIEELNYVISTAPDDTGKIVGTIYKYPEKTFENALFMLALQMKITPIKDMLTIKEISFENIKRGDYLLFAFDDENNNEELDTPSEFMVLL